MAINLNGQRVLVVQAGCSIGRATAKAFVASGAHVVIAGPDGPELHANAAEVGAAAAVLDVLAKDSMDFFFDEHDPFDHIVVVTSALRAGSIRDLALDDAKDAMDSKFWGAYRVARGARVNDGGSVTFVSGIPCIHPTATSILQNAINAALEALSRGFALEKTPIRFNTVSPGIIVEGRHAEPPDPALLPEATSKHVDTRLPVGWAGEAEDVAEAILLLATNRFVTGSTLTIDGGRALL